MPSFAHVQTVQTANAPIQATVNITAEMGQSVSVSCPTGATTEIDISIDVSAVKAFAIFSPKAVTVKTNSSGSPDDTIALAAGIPYIWTTSSADVFALGTDVTKLYIVNASGAAAALRVEVLVDPTP